MSHAIDLENVNRRSHKEAVDEDAETRSPGDLDHRLLSKVGRPASADAVTHWNQIAVKGQH